METQNSKKVADQVAEMIAEAGVRHLYAITGDSLNDLTEALDRDGRVKFVHMRHEESGAFAASAEAQLTGKLAACAGSSGPGHVHLINGLYDAQGATRPFWPLLPHAPRPCSERNIFRRPIPSCSFQTAMCITRWP